MKRFTGLILAGLLGISAMLPVSASAEQNYQDYDENLSRVIDDADVLSDSVEAELTKKIEQIISEHGIDVVLLTIESLDGKSSMVYADDFYDENGYGIGNENDGVLLLISQQDREYWISTTGLGIDIFTDYGIEYIGEEITSYLSDDDYENACEEFVELSEDFIIQAETGEPYDVGNQKKTLASYLILIGIGLLIGLIAAIIVVCIMKSQMKSVKYNNNANCYALKDTMKIQKSRDIFLYKHVDKTKKPEPSSSGGSSTHHSSSGTSHGGGGGKF